MILIVDRYRFCTLILMVIFNKSRAKQGLFILKLLHKFLHWLLYLDKCNIRCYN